ncbi:MAG TPA: prepilin-type N-terminal cleavage/methylation domain-containing protein [Methylomirabilota bacterium]|nr:prepilin-type N-terminal cleavage/methylation domain-containing protein [Methylomirabilota bacterium]
MKLLRNLRRMNSDRRLAFAAARGRSAAGFTMLELMIVITIIFILLGMAAGSYQHSLVRSREAALKNDLFVMRQSIQQYTVDKQNGPQSLDDLVSSGYLREIPKDPITHAADWRVDFGDVLLSVDETSPGITDVHSSSDAVSPFENTPYSSW